jgi:RNA polymerase sigma factor (sigma-70 family)
VIRESAQPDQPNSGGFSSASSEAKAPSGIENAGGALFVDFVRRIRAGDEQAAEALVRKFEPIIRREIRLRIKSTHLNRAFDSMDVCQSVLASFFVRAATGNYELDQAENLVRLLISMARNKLASRVRSEQRLRRDVRRIAMDDPPDLDQLQDGQPSPSEIVSGRELLERFRAGLSDEERQLASLRSEGLPWDEVARRVGGNAHARRVQLSRGVERVSQQLGLDRDALRLKPSRA